MNTILKITIVCFAALAFNNSVSAQNALTKRNIKKAESTSVKSNASSVQTTAVGETNTAVQRQEQKSSTIQTQPATVKQVNSTQTKTPAQMSSKPLQKKTVIQQKAATEPKSVK
jgi:hypothetical protein